MDRTELALARLSNQYLLRAGERMEVLRAMNGLQAQFLSNALHAMRLRSTASVSYTHLTLPTTERV